ncbi:SMI1/KNR4 family protein [Zavarzinella formosa]|uniref:SMI1/KNR4 family protein n=1 Tax=Zavarzinella formosa TaxID=360055 RepID=UPI00031E735E|nr:SMI1/KNR4 family protein [Zavarzinella formosa]
MTDADLTRIEVTLGIALPVPYRTLVVPFTVPACAGNIDTELWDDADRLIELNRELRAGIAFVRPWPEHMFAMGRDGSGCAAAIDLRHPPFAVWWTDRCHLDSIGSGQTSASLQEWAGRYLADLRADLEVNGIDPNGPPETRELAEAQSARAGCQFIIIWIGLAVSLVLVAIGVLAWLGG